MRRPKMNGTAAAGLAPRTDKPVVSLCVRDSTGLATMSVARSVISPFAGQEAELGSEFMIGHRDQRVSGQGCLGNEEL
jgi:hypothetical protein